MKYQKTTRKFVFLSATLAGALSFSQPVSADSEDGGFAGSAGPAPAPAANVTFDTRENYIPPEELPIRDVYIKESLSATPEQLKDSFTTVSVTPDGKQELLPPDDATVRAMLNAIKTIEMQSPGESEAGEPGGNEPDAAGSVSAESVIGADTRVQITGTTVYPYRTAGRIDLGCTGTLIGPRHVLTAGHCVYNIANDQWYSALSFSPGQNGASSPYGKINWSRALSVKGWTTDHKRDYDYAMIVLSQDIGNTVGWMGYGWKNPLPAYNININGYPGDKPSGTMWHAFCALQIIQTYRLYYACDTAGGMSGSATYVYFTNDGKRTIYGIHAYGVSDSTQLNGATRIREEVYNNLKNWKATY